MRLDYTHEHRTRQEQQPANGSSSSSTSQNGASASSPHTNGSTNTVKNGAGASRGSASGDAETNGFHTNGHHNNDDDDNDNNNNNNGTTGNGAVVLAERNTAPFHGHDREEVTRILLQSLSDLGYHHAAKQLSQESGYALESPSVAAFRSAVLEGWWDEAELLLFGTAAAATGEEEDIYGDGGVVLGNGHGDASSLWLTKRKSRSSFGGGGGGSHQNGLGRASHGLPLAEGADTTVLRFLLRQQKYLELLERRDLNAALHVLRNELTPLKTDVGRLHALSSLIMCPSASDLRSLASWDGAQGTSRTTLLTLLSKSIAPSIMIPPHRLATLLTTVQNSQIRNCLYHNTLGAPTLYTDHECAAEDFPLQPLMELRDHADEVWYVDFSHDGSMLATAGKDGLVCVYDCGNETISGGGGGGSSSSGGGAITCTIRHQFREHERAAQATGAGDRGVCCVVFSPDDRYLISCSQNNEFVVVDVRDGRCVSRGDHFDYPVTCAAWLPDSEHFVVGTQGSRRPLGLYSLRPGNTSGGSSAAAGGIVKNHEIYSWRDPPWDPTLKDSGNPTSFRITDCAVTRDGSRMVATTIDNRILMYDLRSKAKVAEWVMENKLTSINFSRGTDGGGIGEGGGGGEGEGEGEDGSGELEMLVNMNFGKVLLLRARDGEVVRRFEGGVRQEDFVVRSCFGGAGEGIVVSGSEDSRVYIWRRQTGVQVAALDAHAPGTVNAVAWHPTNPSIFASAGDDRRVRIWAAASTIQPRATGAGAAPRRSLGGYVR